MKFAAVITSIVVLTACGSKTLELVAPRHDRPNPPDPPFAVPPPEGPPPLPADAGPAQCRIMIDGGVEGGPCPTESPRSPGPCSVDGLPPPAYFPTPGTNLIGVSVQGEGVNVSPTDDPLQQLPPGRISAYFVFNGAVLIERVKVLAFAGPVNIADGLVERRADGSVVAVCTRTITDRHAVWVALDQPITTPTQVAIYVTDQVSRVFLVRFYVAGVPR